MRVVWAVLALSTAAVVHLHGQQVFRAEARVVIVDVRVLDGGRPVPGLTRDDFQVFDQGLPQTISELSPQKLPMDVTLLLDTSGSTSSVLDAFRAHADRIAGLVRNEDRLRVVAFAGAVRDLVPLGPRGPLALGGPLPAGETALFDALVHTLYRRVEPGRRHLVVAFSDGRDTSSLAGAITVNRLARRSEAALHVVLHGAALAPDEALPLDWRLLTEAASVTGGALFLPQAFGSAPDALADVISTFRNSYVLRYTPSTRSTDGWHDIAVRLTDSAKAGFTVRARRGYFAGGGT
jgi:hypothetical protein